MNNQSNNTIGSSRKIRSGAHAFSPNSNTSRKNNKFNSKLVFSQIVESKQQRNNISFTASLKAQKRFSQITQSTKKSVDDHDDEDAQHTS